MSKWIWTLDTLPTARSAESSRLQLQSGPLHVGGINGNGAGLNVSVLASHVDPLNLAYIRYYNHDRIRCDLRGRSPVEYRELAANAQVSATVVERLAAAGWTPQITSDDASPTLNIQMGNPGIQLRPRKVHDCNEPAAWVGRDLSNCYDLVRIPRAIQVLLAPRKAPDMEGA